MPPSTTASPQDGSLIHHWISCRPHPDAMPRYEAVVLGRLGRLADRCALVATHEGRAERLLWGGSAFRDWLDDEVQDHPVARLADEVRWPIEEIVTAALQAGEPARTRCDRITDGVVATWNLVGVPLAHGDGATLVLVHVDPVCTRTELVQAMFGATGQGLMALGTVRDADGAITDFKIVALNQGAALLFGRPASALQWQRLSGLVPRHLGMTGVLAGVVARTERAAFELAIPRSGAPTLHLKVEARAIGDLIAVAMTDVGDIKAREESFRLLFDNNPLPMWLVEPGTARFVAVNEAAIAHYGFSRTEFLTRRLCDLAEPGEAAAPLVAHEAGLRRQRRADGSVIEVTLVERSLAFEGKPVLLGAAIDLTERRRAEARIAHMAQHDALTGLPNRVLFMVRLTETIAAHQCEGTSAALLCLDLDKFKLVNDTLGHPAGDQLLQQAAQRIAGCLKPEDPVARLGGDEFAILLGGADLPAAEAVAERIVAALARPFLIQEQECHVGASIGIAHLPLHGTDPDVLMRNADIALYRAKAGGRGGWRRFAADMDEAVRRRRRRETDLREALTRGELSLAYQPVIESRSGRLTAFEALLRWHHPVEGPIPPGEFVPLAEETGLIGTIGAWVLQTACREAASWPSSARVAVNLSPAQFRDGSLVQVVRRTLDATGLHPSRLELEVTESVLLAASDANVAMLHALRRLGVHIAMDDFGTGYSSLSYLRAFPFDKIKIDRSFVQQVGENAQSAAIVKAVIGLGASLGIVTVAEGIETGAQLEWLREEGCDEVQGYLLGRPMPAAEARGLIAERDRADWADRAACA